MKVAVIGAGITGLSAAWLLSHKHTVTLYEAAPRLGGHANTVDVTTPDGPCPIDTGFIVYNTASYPNLIAFFQHLDVDTAETQMSFAVSLDGGAYEYAGGGLGQLIGHAGNVISPSHWKMTREIFRFFKEASAVEAKNLPLSTTLGQWLSERGYSQHFIHAHIVPMGAAIWSTPAREMLAFPFASFARFFENHGLLQAFNRPAWRTVRGGSRRYVDKVRASIRGDIRIGDGVAVVERDGPRVRVTTQSGHTESYDAALFACHADEARAAIASGDDAVMQTLAAFRYASNEAILHTDTGLMPKRRRLWSSWNYLSSASPRDIVERGSEAQLSVSYWMNSLQPLATKTDYFVTLNPWRPIKPDTIQLRQSYTHPVFDRAALEAQAKLWALQGRNNIWFAGSYLGFGFHEDGIQAGLAAAEHLSEQLGGEAGKVVRPWAWDIRQSRMAGAKTAA